MKKILIFILGAVIGVLGAVGVYLYTQGDVEWAVYLEEQLLPNAVLALSAVSALCVAAMPIINSVNKTLTKFDGATADVKSTVASDKRMLEAITAERAELKLLESGIQAALDEVKALKGEISAQIEPVAKSARNVEEIVHIGFEHNAEIVKSGYAAAIAKVGADNGKERKEE